MAGYEDDIMKFLMKQARKMAKEQGKKKVVRPASKKAVPSREQLSKMSPDKIKAIKEQARKISANKAKPNPKLNRNVGKTAKKPKNTVTEQRFAAKQLKKRFPPDEPPMVGAKR